MTPFLSHEIIEVLEKFYMAKEKEITTNEIIEFLQENMVTKAEAKNFVTKDDLRALEKKIDRKIDALDNKFTIELRSIHNDLGEIKMRLTKLEKRTIEDADAAAKDVLELRNRVDMLEKQVRQLQSANS